MLAIPVRIDMCIPQTSLGIVPAPCYTGSRVVLNDEIVPIRKPKTSIGTDLRHDGRKPFIRTRNQTECIGGLKSTSFSFNIVHSEQMTGRSANKGPPILPGCRESGRCGKSMSTSGGVIIERIDLTNIWSNRKKATGLSNHLSRHSPFSPMDAVGNPTKKAGVIVGSGSKNITLFVESDAPSVVVELMKKFHLRSVRFETKSTRSKIEFFSTHFSVKP